MRRAINNTCMDDCIHLKACRRYAKIIKKEMHGACVPRGCNETCTAYTSGNSELYVSVSDACYVARTQYDGNRDTFDVYCECDFGGKALSELVEEGTGE